MIVVGGVLFVLLAVAILVLVVTLITRKACPSCRSQIARGATVCPKCGSAITA